MIQERGGRASFRKLEYWKTTFLKKWIKNAPAKSWIVLIIIIIIIGNCSASILEQIGAEGLNNFCLNLEFITEEVFERVAPMFVVVRQFVYVNFKIFF